MSPARLFGLFRNLINSLVCSAGTMLLSRIRLSKVSLNQPVHLENGASPTFYLSHKPVIREKAESTKLPIVYDALSRPSENRPSLNDCLESRPLLQNRMLDIMVGNCMYAIVITGNLKQEFLQIRIKKNDRDVLRFH